MLLITPHKRLVDPFSGGMWNDHMQDCRPSSRLVNHHIFWPTPNLAWFGATFVVCCGKGGAIMYAAGRDGLPGRKMGWVWVGSALRLTIGNLPRSHDLPPRGCTRVSGREVSRAEIHRVADSASAQACASDALNDWIRPRPVQSDRSSPCWYRRNGGLTDDWAVDSVDYYSMHWTHLSVFFIVFIGRILCNIIYITLLAKRTLCYRTIQQLFLLKRADTDLHCSFLFFLAVSAVYPITIEKDWRALAYCTHDHSGASNI